MGGVTTAVELLEHIISGGWHGSCIRLWLISLTKLCSTFLIPGCNLLLFCNLLSFFDSYSVTMASSPRLNVYGSEFGMGIAVALRCGNANKFDGKVSSYPGREGGGSID